ncbi:MAG: 2-C-methyl-D-erythritol 2,4-cyclodiphosphate synthase [Chthoniobacterales bacterium]
MNNKIPPFRVGIGYDVHRFATGRRLVLGGLEIPSEMGLLGHSDADVLSHAIADALLGAVGEKDIGYHFPNTDKSIEGICSLDILTRVAEILTSKNAVIGNIDATLIGEKPKIAPHIDSMCEKIAAALGIAANQVGLKATTNEKMGFLGRGEGLAAIATVCIFISER